MTILFRRLFFILIILISKNVFSQDTIIFYNGNEVKCYVVEVSIKQVEYRQSENTSIIVAKRSEIFMIKFKDGHKEILKDNLLKLIKPKQGNLIIDCHLGIPILAAFSLIKYEMPPDTAKNLTFLGLNGEYLINNNTGLGVEYTRASCDFDYSDNQKHYTGNFSKTRILLKYNHYNHDEFKKISTYYSFGAGCKLLQMQTNEPIQREYQFLVADFLLKMMGAPNPKVQDPFSILSIKAACGIRYFFNNHLGLNVELGLGGPLIQVGISGKI